MLAMVASTLILSGAVGPLAPNPFDRPRTHERAPLFAGGDFESAGRRTTSQLPRNIGRSFVGLVSRDNVLPLLIGTAASGTASRFDLRAQASLNGFAPGIASAASTAGGMSVMLPATLGLFAAGRMAPQHRFGAFSYDATQAILVNSITTTALKHAVRRTRPDASDRLSFPSGHTSNAFAVAKVAEAHYGWRVGVPSYIAASAIGLSRVSRDKHHLSDVMAGAAIGYVTGRTVLRVNGQPAARHRTFALHPMTDAQGTGVGMGASLSW
jgi:membrane-associated phospholipid phosphatase